MSPRMFLNYVNLKVAYAMHISSVDVEYIDDWDPPYLMVSMINFVS